MREKLYWTIERFSLRYAYFLFFDTTLHLADQLFTRHKVRVWFAPEYAKEGYPIVAILCRVRKRDVPEFLVAVEELKKEMLLFGYLDYVSEVSAFMDTAEKEKGAADQNEAKEAKQERTTQILRRKARLMEWAFPGHAHCPKPKSL